MTPKEKAENLVLKYSILSEGNNHLVKKCALISVDEIFQVLPDIQGLWEYWYKVKQEIEKL